MRHFRNSEGAYGPRPGGDRTGATAVATGSAACAWTVRAIARAVLIGLGIFLAGGALAGLGMPQAALAQSGTGRDTTAPVDLLATIDTGGQDEDEDGADDAVDDDDPVTETAGLTGDGDADPAVELQVSEPEILFDVNRVGVRLSRNQARGLKKNLWRGTPASRAAQLVSGGLATSASASINALAHASVALLATPPEGTTNELMELLRARLGWLQSAGRSDDLATLVDQVPDSGEWIEWKRWLVETQLMSRRDSQACGYVSEQAKRSLDEFWQKSEVICRISQGDSQSARFALDAFGLLGIDDPVFDTLVNVLLYDRDPGLIDSSLLVPLHVVLMDAAHLSIGLGGIEALADGSVQSAISLRYLDRDARLVSTLRALSLGLIDHDRAANLWRLVEFERQDTAAAVARHQSRATELTRARAWRALAKDRTPVRLPLVAAALVTDIQNGAGNLMLPLYADLVREALDFRGAPEYVLSEDEQIRAILGFILAVSDNRPIPDFLNHPDGRAAREIMDMQETGKWDAAPIERLGVWQLLPLLEVITSGETRTRTSDARDERSSRRRARDDGARDGRPDAQDPQDPQNVRWLELAATPYVESPAYVSTSPVVLRALDQAAANGNVAETVLLAHRVARVPRLASLHPADAARVVSALRAVGHEDTATAFSQEVLLAHMLEYLHGKAEEFSHVRAGAVQIWARANSDDAGGAEIRVESQERRIRRSAGRLGADATADDTL